jgi:hypothetical protein
MGAMRLTSLPAGTYLITVNVAEDWSGITAGTAPLYTEYQLYNFSTSAAIALTQRIGTDSSTLGAAIVGQRGGIVHMSWIVVVAGTHTIDLQGRYVAGAITGSIKVKGNNRCSMNAVRLI